jgi:hypothetical protein
MAFTERITTGWQVTDNVKKPESNLPIYAAIAAVLIAIASGVIYLVTKLPAAQALWSQIPDYTQATCDDLTAMDPVKLTYVFARLIQYSEQKTGKSLSGDEAEKFGVAVGDRCYGNDGRRLIEVVDEMAAEAAPQ